jgi:hypothetical protein
MVAGGLIGSVLMGALLFWPGVRDPERQPLPETDETDEAENLEELAS